MHRLNLNVSFAEKEEAKAFGAKWDSKEKTWYISFDPSRLTDDIRSVVVRWSRVEERHWLECPNELTEYAVKRGAFRDAQTGRVFIPYGYPESLEGCHVLYRLPYWLPSHPEFLAESEGGLNKYSGFKKTYTSHEKAALAIANNSSYTPIDHYLPEEREAMDIICAAKQGWYLHQGKSEHKGDHSYYRCEAWDSW